MHMPVRRLRDRASAVLLWPRSVQIPELFCASVDLRVALDSHLTFLQRSLHQKRVISTSMLNLTAVAPLLSKQGIYGPVTATLDWCEVRLLGVLQSRQVTHSLAVIISATTNGHRTSQRWLTHSPTYSLLQSLSAVQWSQGSKDYRRAISSDISCVTIHRLCLKTL